MNTEMEDIYRLALSNMATGLQDIEDRVAHLEKQLDVPAPHRTAFDLKRYRNLLKFRITNLKQIAKGIDYGEDILKHKIEAYEHALKLIDA